MSEFEIKKLGDVVELVIDNRGRNPKSYEAEGIPVVDNYLITSDGEARLSEVKRFIDDDTYNSFLRKYIKEGDVLMTLVGNGYGKVATAPKEKCAIIQNTIGLRCDEKNNNQYLYYLLRSSRNALMNLNRGAAQPSIKVGDVLDLEFQFPPLYEQERVARILKSIDKKIELNRQTNQTLEHMAQAIFKSWFVDFEPTRAKQQVRENIAQGRMPGSDGSFGTEGSLPKGFSKEDEAQLMERAAMAAISGKAISDLDQLSPEQQQQLKTTAASFPDALVDSELGEVPAGWEEMHTTIGGISEVYDGPHATPKKTEVGPVFLGIGSLCKGQLDLTKSAHLSEEQFIKWTKRITPKAGDVVFSYETRLGEAAIIPPDLICCLGRRMGLLRAKEGKVIPEILLLCYLSEQFQELITSRVVHGSTVDRIPLKDLPNFPISVPPYSVQTALCSYMVNARSMINKNNDESINLKRTRDVLLPKLLSGELTLDEKDVA